MRQLFREKAVTIEDKEAGMTEGNAPRELVLLWISGDRETALKMAFMYAGNSKKRGWWEEVTLIVWGPSAKLLAEDEELQGELVGLRRNGVVLEACKACSDSYGVTQELESLGVEVKYMGQPLTGYLKDGCRVLSV
jgi:hypothetical protein